ncbi:hypothetical protein B296_00036898 [Ensete ventricosum]|uniref:ATPase AAA-type core domain-containing protein n=1 Tax=Ensete ventricosum TaxID=4639 RepID=A0A426YTZ1_ENSVE|nr:hypothetical protein B296_00036898 [Ensete ventricosum]
MFRRHCYNQLLQILVIGATNRVDILDPALLRKGRFDRIIRVGLPSKDGRVAILQVPEWSYFTFWNLVCLGLCLGDCRWITFVFMLHSLGTPDKLPLIDRNEAGILTARKDQDYIGREELLEALKRVRCPICQST